MGLVTGEPGAVVAADIDHQVTRLEAEARDEPLGALLKMSAQGLCRAGNVEVFAEHRFLRHGVINLHGRAVVAKAYLQRIIRLPPPQVLRAQQAITVRLVAQVEKLFEPFAAANSALHKAIKYRPSAAEPGNKRSFLPVPCEYR